MIMNLGALGWLSVIALVSIIVGVAGGLSRGIGEGVIAAILMFVVFGGIEAAYIFFYDQSLLKSRGSKQTPYNKGSEQETGGDG